jgi:hypothetical protein
MAFAGDTSFQRTAAFHFSGNEAELLLAASISSSRVQVSNFDVEYERLNAIDGDVLLTARVEALAEKVAHRFVRHVKRILAADIGLCGVVQVLGDHHDDLMGDGARSRRPLAAGKLPATGPETECALAGGDSITFHRGVDVDCALVFCFILLCFRRQ